MDGLIERQLLLAEAKRLGVSVGEEELTKELTSGRLRISLPAAMLASRQIPHAIVPVRERFLDRKTRQFSPAEYKKAIGEFTQLSEEDYREFQRGRARRRAYAGPHHVSRARQRRGGLRRVRPKRDDREGEVRQVRAELLRVPLGRPIAEGDRHLGREERRRHREGPRGAQAAPRGRLPAGEPDPGARREDRDRRREEGRARQDRGGEGAARGAARPSPTWRARSAITW
jgi:hypothetical protein